MIAVLFLLPGQRDLENVAEERWENVSLARDLANTHANSHAPDKLIATDGEARVTTDGRGPKQSHYSDGRNPFTQRPLYARCRHASHNPG